MGIPRKNPFAPGYGKRPPVFAGRVDILDDFADALDSPQHPATSMLISGPRGIGKTVTLDQLADIARTQGWQVVRTSAVQKDWLDALTETVVRDYLSFTDNDHKTRLTGLSVLGIGVDLDRPDQLDFSTIRLRQALTAYAEALAEQETGLALIIDEAQSADVDDIRALGDDHQLVAESAQLPVTLTLATLPSLEAELEGDNRKATFLQRMNRRTLDRLTDEEVTQAVTGPYRVHGVTFSEKALADIQRHVAGAPFFAQLVGFELWKTLRGTEIIDIESSMVNEAADRAHVTYGRTVVDTLFNDITPLEKTFLMAAAMDPESSDMRDIAERIRRDTNNTYQYRHRLINADVIYPTGRRLIAFVDPAVKTHIQGLPQFEEFRRKIEAPESPPTAEA